MSGGSLPDSLPQTRPLHAERPGGVPAVLHGVPSEAEAGPAGGRSVRQPGGGAPLLQLSENVFDTTK